MTTIRFPQMPVVDRSDSTAELAAQALAFIRNVDVRPWSPAAEPVFHQPRQQQHANAGTPGMRFGQFDTAPMDLPEPESWRLVDGSFLLGGMPGSGKSAAAWMAARTSEGLVR